MIDRERKVGICGTFDVQNYGDLLFPLIAEAELKHRLGRVTLHPFSYSSKAPPDWPYAVRSLVDLPSAIGELDGLVVGGGHLIRFDQDVAPGYGPPAPSIHHPTGYWLTPALIALQNGLPVAWNAPGVHGEIPAWAEPLMQVALGGSGYVSVRDDPSRQALLRFAPPSGIAVVPDTVFGIGQLIDAERPSADLVRLRAAAGLGDRYVVVQATRGLEAFARLVRDHPETFDGRQLVLLPIGPVLGDDVALFGDDLPNAIRLPSWPTPLLLAELIGRSAGVVGVSLHMAITALAMGVPVFRPSDVEAGGKYSVLSDFDTVAHFAREPAIDPRWFAGRLGRTAPTPAVAAAVARLSDHWDGLARTLADGDGKGATLAAFGSFVHSLPGLLEEGAVRSAAGAEERAAVGARDRPIRALEGQLADARAAIDDRDRQLAALRRSKSWKVTAPLRMLGRRLRRSERRHGRGMIDLRRIGEETLATHPYHWACANDLFTPSQAAALAASFPRDHFKTVTGYDGEKGYVYEARSLIHMGAGEASHAADLSDAWRRLAADLLSTSYRRAMTRLTGCDLEAAPCEVNLFHYGPGAWLGPHVDLKDKIATHILYFNQEWDMADGGCLTILRSSDMSDAFAEIAPIVGRSAVVVRSDRSWHAVSRVREGCRRSRRSMTVTFYHPGSVSTMWPPGDATPLHGFEGGDD